MADSGAQPDHQLRGAALCLCTVMIGALIKSGHIVNKFLSQSSVSYIGQYNIHFDMCDVYCHCIPIYDKGVKGMDLQ